MFQFSPFSPNPLYQTDHLFTILFLVFCLILFSVGLILFFRKCIKLHTQKKNRQLFRQHYKITILPKSITVTRNKRSTGFCYYELSYPHWAHPKSDGTRDGRYRSNGIVWKQSNLYLDDYTLTSLYPYDLLFMVQVLRAQGIPIRRTVEELEKQHQLQRKDKVQFEQITADSIVKQYADKPTNFENFCAALFSEMGFSTTVTSKTRDGGFDIYLRRATETGIVECKCYNANHSIGRPAIQKLVGANQIEHADTMYFVTTSSFSVDAATFARQTGVILIDGVNLASLAVKHFAPSAKALKSDAEIRSKSEFTVEDMRPYVPKDIFTLYFEPHL